MESTKYTDEELASLRDFVDMVKDGKLDEQMSCWGDYSDYSHGY